MQFLLNIPLKFKFWLVNMVSFAMALALAAYAMSLYTHSAQAHDRDQAEAQLQQLLTMAQALPGDQFLNALPQNVFVLAPGAGGQAGNSAAIPEEVRIELMQAKASAPVARLVEPELLNLEETAYWVIGALHQDGTRIVGLKLNTASYAQTFLSQAPGYAGAVFVLMLGLLMVSQLLISFIERHVNRLREIMLRVQRENDLTLRVHIDCRDEIGQMAEAFNQMQAGYQHTVSHMRDSASRLGEEVLNLTRAAEDTNRQMERQQQETDQVVTAMHQMTAAAQEVAQNASGTHEVSEVATGKTNLGNERVRQTRDAILKLSEEILAASRLIEQLNENSHRIESATSQIQTISEQTNLLALNAAIEAARAGSVGRGFAVVADEVRNLAMHAHQASGAINQVVASIRQVAEQVTDTMESSRAMANGCVEKAEDAAVELQEINQVVEQIKDKNLMIATAAEEQSQVSETISNGLRAIREDTLKTSVNANAVSRSGHEIRQQADRLIKLVESMRV